LLQNSAVVTVAKAAIMQSGQFVCHSICLCHWAGFMRSWYYDWAYQSEELVVFWWWSGLGYGFRITCPLPSALRNRGF